MDRVRHALAVGALTLYAPGLLFWLLIHPLARFWRRLGPTAAYLIVGSALLALGIGMFARRDVLIGRDLGTTWLAIVPGIAVFAVLFWLGARSANHLSLATRMGVPELSAGRQQTLMRDGIYRFVRHPIYASAIAGGAAFALVVNYLGTYVLILVSVPVLYLITRLEERELIARFGHSYREYQREVPRLVPRVRQSS